MECRRYKQALFPFAGTINPLEACHHWAQQTQHRARAILPPPTTHAGFINTQILKYHNAASLDSTFSSMFQGHQIDIVYEGDDAWIPLQRRHYLLGGSLIALLLLSYL